MKFVIADDHALFRAGIRTALSEAFGADTVVFEAADYAQTKAVVSEHDDADLVLCDLHMPGMNEFEGLRKLIEFVAALPVVIVSASDDPGDVRCSIDCGARGYIFKHQSFEILQSALELVLAGGIYVPAEAFWAADPASQLPVEAYQPAASALSALSPRQTAIARLLADGMSNKEIARQLDVAEGTVKAQVKSIFRKLGVRNRTEAALFASRHFTTATRMRQQVDINHSEIRPGDGDDLHPDLLQKVYAFRKRG